MRSGIKAFALILAALAVATGFGVESRVEAQEPPLPTNRIVSRFPYAASVGQYDLVQLVLDFEPGAVTQFHNHSGPVFVTVLAGTITRTEGGMKTVHATGQTFTELTGAFHTAGNEGSTKARVMATLLLEPGGVPTINQPDSRVPALVPTITFLSRTTLGTQPAEFDVVNVVVDFGSGGYLPLHTHGGPGLVTLIEGEVLFSSAAAGQARRAPGGIFLDTANAHDARNVGSGPATALASFLIRKGEAVTTFVTPPAAAPAPQQPVTLPRAGDGGLVDSAGRGDNDMQLTLAAAMLLFAALSGGAVYLKVLRNR
jgi:quercetin dioxygenase-like cupin family protein